MTFCKTMTLISVIFTINEIMPPKKKPTATCQASEEQKKRRNPVGIWCQNDVVSTSIYDVDAT